MCVSMCVHVRIGQRRTAGITSQVLSTLVFDTGSLINLKLVKQVGLAASQPWAAVLCVRLPRAG